MDIIDAGIRYVLNGARINDGLKNLYEGLMCYRFTRIIEYKNAQITVCFGKDKGYSNYMLLLNQHKLKCDDEIRYNNQGYTILDTKEKSLFDAQIQILKYRS